MRIKKIAPVTPANGNIENTYGTSQTNTYSQEYQNAHNVVVSATQPTTSERVWFKNTRNVWQLPNSDTSNGVTLTNNGDGTITLNGTATANADFYVSVNSSDYQNGVNYYLSSNINSSDITLIIANYNGNTYVNSMVNSNQQMPFTMNITNDKLRFIIRALSGKTFNNTIIKIQLEKGNVATPWTSIYERSIYVDNEEIYNKDNIVDLTSQVEMQTGFTKYSGNVYRIGKVVYVKLVIEGEITTSDKAVLKLPIKPKDNINSGCFLSTSLWSSTHVGYMFVSNTNGIVSVKGSSTFSAIKYDFSYIID